MPSATALSTATATPVPTPHAAAAPLLATTGVAAATTTISAPAVNPVPATGTATATATATALPTATATALSTVTATSTAAAPLPSPTAGLPAVASASATFPSSYTASRSGTGALEIQGADGLFARADVAVTDPVTGRRRFRGWLRAAHGPVFGVAADGRLEWIGPADTADLAEIDWARVQTVPDAALAAAALAMLPPGSLVWDFRGSGRVYPVGEDRLLHHVPDPRTLATRFGWRNVLPLGEAQLA